MATWANPWARERWESCPTVVGRLHILTRPKLFVPDKAVEGRIEGVDIAHVGFFRNIETSQVIASIDYQTPKSSLTRSTEAPMVVQKVVPPLPLGAS